MVFSHRGTRDTRIPSILLLGFVLLTGTAFPRQAGSLAPLICPPPDVPSSFWGYVTLNGVAVPTGLKLAAWINGIEVASTTTQASASGTDYLIDVPASVHDTATGEVCHPGGAPGETVSFVLCNAVTANETGSWSIGSQVQLNLTASGACQPPTNTPTVTPTGTPAATATSLVTPSSTSTQTATLTRTPSVAPTPASMPTVGFHWYLPFVLQW